MATNQKIKRVKYSDNQFLRREDLTDEQDYHLKMHRLHNVSHHTWGIVRGLELTVDEKTGTAQLKKGIAVDGYGREVVLSNYEDIKPEEFRIKNIPEGTAALDVFIRFQTVSVKSADPRYLPCCDRNCSGSCDDRLLEGAKIETKMGILNPDQRPIYHNDPEESQPNDSSIDLDLEDDDKPWHIFLGQIVREVDSVDNYKYRIDSAWRRYAGLVASTVRSPDNSVELQLGNKDQLFTLRVPSRDAKTGLSPASSKAAPTSSSLLREEEKVIELGKDGRLDLRVSEAIITGDVMIRNGSLGFTEPLAGITKDTAHERSIYLAKHQLTSDAQGKETKPSADKQLTDKQSGAKASTTEPERGSRPTALTELRIDLGTKKDESSTDPITQFAIGTFPEKGQAFAPILTVRNDGDVVISGKLIINELSTDLPLAIVNALREAGIFSSLREKWSTLNEQGRADLLRSLAQTIQSAKNKG